MYLSIRRGRVLRAVSLGLIAISARSVTAAETIIEARYERIGDVEVVVSATKVSRTDWTCSMPSTGAPVTSCSHPTAHTRVWTLDADTASNLATSLSDAGFFRDGPSGTEIPGHKAVRSIAVSLRGPDGVYVIRRETDAAEVHGAPGFDAAQSAFLALTPPKLTVPTTYKGALPGRADVEMTLDSDGGYRLVLRIPSHRARPAGGAAESGRWAFDQGTSTLHLSPEHGAVPVRIATLTGGPHPTATLGLDGYFPDSATVTLGEGR